MRQENFISSKGTVAGATANLFQVMSEFHSSQEMAYQGQWRTVATAAESFKFLDPAVHSLKSVHRDCSFHHPEMQGSFRLGISQLEWDKHWRMGCYKGKESWSP